MERPRDEQVISLFREQLRHIEDFLPPSPPSAGVREPAPEPLPTLPAGQYAVAVESVGRVAFLSHETQLVLQ